MFLYFVLLRPQESTISGQVVIEVEFDIYCIESNLQFIITKLIERIRYSDVFEAEYLQLKYPSKLSENTMYIFIGVIPHLTRPYKNYLHLDFGFFFFSFFFLQSWVSKSV